MHFAALVRNNVKITENTYANLFLNIEYHSCSKHSKDILFVKIFFFSHIVYLPYILVNFNVRSSETLKKHFFRKKNCFFINGVLDAF